VVLKQIDGLVQDFRVLLLVEALHARDL
jgi:hypothetical protein